MGDVASPQTMYSTHPFGIPDDASEALRYDRIICNGTKVCTVVFEPDKDRHRAFIRSIASAPCVSGDGGVIDLESMPSEIYEQIYRPARDAEAAAALVDITSDGNVIRIGQSLYVADSLGEFERFSALPKDLSLSIGDVAKRGSQVVVTSRERVTQKAFSQWIKAGSSETAAKHPVLTETAETSETTDEPEATSIDQADTTAVDKNSSVQKAPQGTESDGDTDSDSHDSGSEGDSNATDDFSAAESWIEGSSEPDVDELAEDAAPLYTSAFRELNETSEERAESDSDESAAESTDEVVESDEDRLHDHSRYVDWSSDNEGLFDRGDEPEDDDGRYAPDDFWSDYDGMHEDEEVDSDDEVDKSRSKKRKAVNKQIESEPVAQLHVFNVSNGEHPQVFHFARRYNEGINNSRPAVHPFKPLVVWPIGNQRVLFADTKHNSYFYRKLRSSQPGSTQISVESHFSDNGKFLHMATLEQRAMTPSRKNDKASTDPTYDLLVSTYRLSSRKTTRSPPVLTYRVKLHVGPLPKTDLAFQWFDDEVIVSCCAKRLTVFRIQLFRSQAPQGVPALVPRNTIELPDSAAERAVHFTKVNASRFAVVIVAPEPVADRKKDSKSEELGESEDDKDKAKEAESPNNSESKGSDSKIEADTNAPEDGKDKAKDAVSADSAKSSGSDAKVETEKDDKQKDDEANKEEPRVVLIEDHPKDTYAVFLDEEKDLGGWIRPSPDTALKIKEDVGIGHFEQEAVEVDQEDDCCDE